MGFITNIVERVKRLFGKTAFQNSQLVSTFITDEMATAIDRWARLYANKAPWLEKNSQSIGLPSAIAREISTLVTLEMQLTVTDPHSNGASDTSVAFHQEGIRWDYAANSGADGIRLCAGWAGFQTVCIRQGSGARLCAG